MTNDTVHPRVKDRDRKINSLTGIGPPTTTSPNVPIGTDYSDADPTGGGFWYMYASGWAELGAGGGSTAWADLTGVPTSVAGYGITDVYTKSASDARYQAAGSYQAPATTLAGYGITDAYTKTAADARYQAIGTYQTPQTTLAGYGITDAYTKTAADARYLQLSGGTLTAGLSGTTATFSSTLHAGGAATFASTLDVTGEISAPSASIGGSPVAVVRTGAYTSVPGDLAAGQIYFGY